MTLNVITISHHHGKLLNGLYRKIEMKSYPWLEDVVRIACINKDHNRNTCNPTLELEGFW